ncbi:hypothetical protein VTJ04DRAFT_2863 [Mycothermus thermophilus]|uniref:uncharacterized protein n=1 Tax=Humicola insolens TaxID=85995 RepID=UPI003741FCCD
MSGILNTTQPDVPGSHTGTRWAAPTAVPSQPRQYRPPRMALGSDYSGRRFECSVPGCGRHFTRKEHLTRHVKSHSPQLQHQCPICGRRYARSDVLKRHIEFHPQSTTRGHKLAACVSCRERKLKCDEETPCRSCARSCTECVRLGQTTPACDTNQQTVPENSSTMNASLSVDMDVIMANSNLEANPDPTNPVLQPTMRPSDVGIINSAWITGNQAHSSWMSELPLTPLSALPSPNAFTSLADLSLPSQSTGATPSQESTLISTEHLTMSSANGPLALDGLSATWNPVADQGIADTPSDLVTGSDGASFSTLPMTGTPRTKPPSSISSRITDQPLNAGASAAVSQTRSTATSFSPREVPTVEGGLHALLYHDPTALRELVDIFFSEIHPYWPILHVPTFEIGIASDTLLGSMVMLASWIIGRNEHLDLAPLVFDAVMSATGLSTVPSLHSLQAMLLTCVYAVCRRAEEGMLAKAVHLNSIMISTCRCFDIFSGHNILPDRMEDCAFTLWLAKEQLHRLAFSVLRLDTYLSILVDHPPAVRYQELSIPLPKSSQLWMAASEEERRKLQWEEPAGREKALFNNLMRDVLMGTGGGGVTANLPYRLSPVDYHLGLCAMQVGIWDAAREAHSAASDELVTKLHPGDPIVTWRTLLGQWKRRMVQECGLTEGAVEAALAETIFSSSSPSSSSTNAANSDGETVLNPWTLMLVHISTIKMHAPLNLLRVHGSFFHQGVKGPNLAVAAAMAAVAKPHARMRRWMASNCPRKAVRSAAQIARLVTATDGGGMSIGQATFPSVSSQRASSFGFLSSNPANAGASANHYHHQQQRQPQQDDNHLHLSTRRLLLNPLAIPGLLMGAIVTCSYASRTAGACPNCAGANSNNSSNNGSNPGTPSSYLPSASASNISNGNNNGNNNSSGGNVLHTPTPTPNPTPTPTLSCIPTTIDTSTTNTKNNNIDLSFNLCTAPDDYPALITWIEEGVGWPVWDLAWALERDGVAKGEFEAFFAGLL